MARMNACDSAGNGRRDYAEEIKTAPKGTLKRFLGYYRPHVLLLVADLLCALLMAGLEPVARMALPCSVPKYQ